MKIKSCDIFMIILITSQKALEDFSFAFNSDNTKVWELFVVIYIVKWCCFIIIRFCRAYDNLKVIKYQKVTYVTTKKEYMIE